MGSILGKFLAGGAAGLLAWMICEPFAPKDFATYVTSDWEGTFVVVVGALVGLAIGALDGYSRGGKVHTIRGALLGLFFGAIGMAFGHDIGGLVAHLMFGPGVFSSDNPLINIVPRAIAFTFIGVSLGAAIGAASLNGTKILQGAIGGAIGSVFAGFLFDPISMMVGHATMNLGGGQEEGGPGRAILALLLGAGIALFIGIVDRLARSAWLRLQLGRNEGREWSIDSAQTFIGRREGVQVPLFGDPNVAPVHASIVRQGGQYILVDGGSPIGTFLNGQRVSQAALFPGATIQIGSFALQFLMKAGRAPAHGPEAFVGQAYPLGGPGYPQPQPVPGTPTQAYPQPTPSFPTQAFPQSPQPTIAVAPSGLCFVAIDGPLMGQRFQLGQPVDVGRDSPAIPMSFDTAASRRHASLAPGPNGVAVTDLGSTNGTFVNGQRVTQAFAKLGDLVKIGSTTFRVESV